MINGELELIRMVNPFRNLLYDLRAAKELKNFERLPFYAEILNEQNTLRARQMLARVYVSKGVVQQKSLTVQGTISDSVDPYWRQSIYYGVFSKDDPDRILMTARLIRPVNRLESLQLHLDDLSPGVREKLQQIDLKKVAEFAAYVKEPGLDPLTSRVVSLYLIREMVWDSRKRGIETWLFGMRPELQRKYARNFGPALHRLGKKVHLGRFNAIFVPYKVDIEAASRRLQTSSYWRLGSRTVSSFIGKVHYKNH
ncbi:MAG TPA: hypothetical protein VFO38_05035 [Candidatus Saccharimonadales bacterium]|nr:hypothetical protein [Candidatus Saccharimonadales bacterium]